MKILSRLLIFPAALVIFAVSASAQVKLDALQRDGYGVVPIHQPKPNMLTVPATINGAKLKLVLDTGFAGDGISLDAVHARKLGLTGSAEKSDGVTASGKKIQFESKGKGKVMLGNAQIDGVPLSFGNFQGLRNVGSFQTGTHIDMDAFLAADGFISAGFLRTCSAVIDLQNSRLYLRPPGTGRRASLGPALTAVGMAAAPFTQSGDECIADVEINGAPTRLVMDTGMGLTQLDHRFASQIHAIAFKNGIEFHDAAGVKEESYQTPIHSFKIAGVPIRSRDLQLGNLSVYSSSGGKIAGMLGMDVLGQNWSIIDFGEHKLYIAQAR